MEDRLKGKLFFEYSDSVQRVTYQFEEAFDNKHDYVLWITLPQGKDIDLSKIRQGLSSYILRKLNGKAYQRDFPERVELLRYALDNQQDLLDCEEISIKGKKDEDVADVLKCPAKKVVIDDTLHPLTIEEVTHLETLYPDTTRTYFYVEQNVDPISLEEYRFTTEIIDEVADKIKGYGLSPLEAAVYAYDYTRDRLYIAEEKGESFTLSRDLTKVLTTDLIVCVGYSRILAAILNKAGVPASAYAIDYDEEGHAIVVARIKDEKYGIDTLLYFDPTKDRKLDNTSDHFHKYTHFGISRNKALDYGSAKDTTFGDFDKDKYHAAIESIKTGNRYDPKQAQIEIALHNIQDFLAGKSAYEGSGRQAWKPLEYEESLHDDVDLIASLLGEGLEPSKKMEAISRVRRLEFYEDPTRFPYSSAVLKKIAKTSDCYHSYYARESSGASYLEPREHEHDLDAKRLTLTKTLSRIRDKQ